MNRTITALVVLVVVLIVLFALVAIVTRTAPTASPTPGAEVVPVGTPTPEPTPTPLTPEQVQLEDVAAGIEDAAVDDELDTALADLETDLQGI